jgi:hypothetical protein
MNNIEVINLLKIIWPIIAIQFALQIYAIYDILKLKTTKNLTPTIWIIIVIVGEILGPVVYFIVGRSEKLNND